MADPNEQNGERLYEMVQSMAPGAAEKLFELAQNGPRATMEQFKEWFGAEYPGLARGMNKYFVVTLFYAAYLYYVEQQPKDPPRPREPSTLPMAEWAYMMKAPCGGKRNSVVDEVFDAKGH